MCTSHTLAELLIIYRTTLIFIIKPSKEQELAGNATSRHMYLTYNKRGEIKSTPATFILFYQPITWGCKTIDWGAPGNKENGKRSQAKLINAVLSLNEVRWVLNYDGLEPNQFNAKPAHEHFNLLTTRRMALSHPMPCGYFVPTYQNKHTCTCYLHAHRPPNGQVVVVRWDTRAMSGASFWA